MLSLKNGGVAPHKAKAALLEIMTPELRKLFETTVEPVLDLLRFRDELAAKERAKATWEGALVKNGKKLQQAQKTVEAMKEDTMYRSWMQGKAAHVEKVVSKEEDKLDKARKAIAKLRSKVNNIGKRKAVGPALAELEAPIIETADDAAAAASASASARKPKPPQPSKPSSTRDTKPPAPKKARRQQQEKQQQQKKPSPAAASSPRPTWLPTLLVEHADLSSTVLDFLGGGSALRGLGATAPALRAAVKAVLPRLAVRVGNANDPLFALEEYSRLQHLSVRAGWGLASRDGEMAAKIVSLGLPARLQSFSLTAPEYGEVLVSHQWPQLRLLNTDFLFERFLTAVRAKPATVFPRLCSLQTYTALQGEQARKLLALLDRGAFPQLARLTPPSSDSSLVVGVATAEDTAQQAAVLTRLPGTTSIQLGSRYGVSVAFDSFVPALLGGGLAHLKSLTIFPGSSGTDASSFFNALGSGALPRLQHLALGDSYDAFNAAGQLDLMPNALPGLRSLHVHADVPNALVAGLFAAAGPGLSEIELDVGVAATAGVRLIGEQDYAWMPSLRRLSLKWTNTVNAGGAGAWEDDTAPNTAAALARLPALKTLKITPQAYDELLVRILVLAEGGGLPSLSKLHLGDNRFAAALTDGAILLLLLWVKREMKKAVEGQAPAVTWEVEGLLEREMHDSVKKATQDCFAQIREARRHVCV